MNYSIDTAYLFETREVNYDFPEGLMPIFCNGQKVNGAATFSDDPASLRMIDLDDFIVAGLEDGSLKIGYQEQEIGVPASGIRTIRITAVILEHAFEPSEA